MASSVGPPPPYPVDPQRDGPKNLFDNLSPEEKKVLGECQSDSFYYRALPLGLIFGAVVTRGVKMGNISAAGRFGMAPKVFAAGTLGYFLGKVHYFVSGVCQDKILTQIPNSNLATQVKQSRSGGKGPLPDDGAGVSGRDDGFMARGTAPQAPGNQSAPATSQFPQPSPDGSGEAYGAYFGQPQQPEPIDRPRMEGTLSYDQLRNHHRNQHSPRTPPPAQQPPLSAQPPQQEQQLYMPLDPAPPATDTLPSGGVKRNKYGDEVFE